MDTLKMVDCVSKKMHNQNFGGSIHVYYALQVTPSRVGVGVWGLYLKVCENF